MTRSSDSTLAAEQMLRSAAPPVTDEYEIADLARRSKRLAVPKRSRRQALLICAVVTVAVGIAGFAAMPRKAAPLVARVASAPTAASPEPRIHHPGYLGPIRTFRDTMTPENFGRTTAADLEERYGIRLAFPSVAGTGTFEGIKEYHDGNLHQYTAVYTNDVLILFWAMPSAKDAERYAQDDLDGDVGRYASIVAVGEATGVATPRLDVPPEVDWTAKITDSSGVVLYRAKPGTGIFNGRGDVSWHRGRYFLQVMSDDIDLSTLIDVARAVVLEPNP